MKFNLQKGERGKCALCKKMLGHVQCCLYKKNKDNIIHLNTEIRICPKCMKELEDEEQKEE